MVDITDRMPAEVRAYRDALAAYNLAAAEWLGLRPDEVFWLDVTEAEPDPSGWGPPSLVRVEWKTLTRRDPRIGRTNWGAFGDYETTTFTGEVVLDGMDSDTFTAAIGPKPRMFSRAQELMLKGLAAEAAERSSS